MAPDLITILWIEDNPLQNSLYGKQINKQSESNRFEAEFAGTRIPAIFFTREDQKLSRHFRLKVLQHPEEIKEYVSACLELEDKKGPKQLGVTNGALPEIIVFDYKLFEFEGDENDTLKPPEIVPYTSRMKPVRQRLNPVFEIYAMHQDIFPNRTPFFEDPKIDSYGLIDFVKAINRKSGTPTNEKTTVPATSELTSDILAKDILELRNDQLGLLSGVVISRLFREHACVAVPATFNHPDVSRMHISSKFFEWVNGFDLGEMFSSGVRGEKEWDQIIPHGVKKLRIKIQEQLKSGKLIPSYAELIDLSSNDATGSQRVFSFRNSYGERQLPLEALFIDKRGGQRDIETKEWAKALIGELKQNDTDIEKALKASEDLWNVYVSENFRDRMELSNLGYWDNIGVDVEKERFEELKNKFFGKDQKIKDERSIQTAFSKLGNTTISFTLRLAMLHLATTAAIRMNQCREHALDKGIYRELDELELFNLFFPLVNLKNNSLMLPTQVKGKTEKRDLMEQGEGWLYRKLGVGRSNCFDFKNWPLLPGEKLLLRSIFFKQDKFFPAWLR